MGKKRQPNATDTRHDHRKLLAAEKGIDLPTVGIVV